MPTNKYASIRYIALDRCFSNFNRKYYFNDLLELVNKALAEYEPNTNGVQVRQLRDDIAFMKHSEGYNAPIVAIREGRKAFYRYEDPDFSIAKAELNSSEAELVKNALNVLTRFEGQPQFEWLNEVGPALLDRFGLHQSEKKVIGFDSNIYYKGYEHIGLLFQSISNQKVVLMTSKNFNGDQFQFKFHPYYLKQYNHRWFAFGYNEENQHEQWNVPLDRIVSFKETNDQYRKDETNWEDYFDDIIGVTKMEGKVEEVELLFEKQRAPYVVTKPLHHSQKNYPQEGGKLKCIIKVIPNFELETLLLSFGNSVSVNKPTKLIERINQRRK